MNRIDNIPNKLWRIDGTGTIPAGDETHGMAHVKARSGAMLRVLFSTGEGWDHVSVSRHARCPSWEEMCEVRDLFWPADDCVMQLHPPAASYVNLHPFCLHLWKPNNPGVAIPQPPAWMVGPVTGRAA